MGIAVVGDLKQAASLATGQPKIIQMSRARGFRTECEIERNDRLARVMIEVRQIEHALCAPEGN